MVTCPPIMYTNSSWLTLAYVGFCGNLGVPRRISLLCRSPAVFQASLQPPSHTTKQNLVQGAFHLHLHVLEVMRILHLVIRFPIPFSPCSPCGPCNVFTLLSIGARLTGPCDGTPSLRTTSENRASVSVEAFLL